MTKIKLNKTNKLYIEPRGENQTRLVVLEGENEYVCRIEKISVLEKFIGEKEGLIQGKIAIESGK